MNESHIFHFRKGGHCNVFFSLCRGSESCAKFEEEISVKSEMEVGESRRKFNILKEGEGKRARGRDRGPRLQLVRCIVSPRPSVAPIWRPKPGFPSAPEMERKSTKRPICGGKASQPARQTAAQQPTTLSGEAERMESGWPIRGFTQPLAPSRSPWSRARSLSLFPLPLSSSAVSPQASNYGQTCQIQREEGGRAFHLRSPLPLPLSAIST